MLISRGSNVRLFFTQMEYDLLTKWMQTHRIQGTKFVIVHNDKKGTFELQTGPHGYSLSKAETSERHPWTITMPLTQLEGYGYFSTVKCELVLGDKILIKIDKDLLASSSTEEHIPRRRNTTVKEVTKEIRPKVEDKSFVPTPLKDVPLPDNRLLNLAEFIGCVDDINLYIKENQKVLLEVKNGFLVYLISNG